MSRVTAYVGLGSNLADPRAQVLGALAELEGVARTRLVARSSLYRSAAIGGGAQPDYVNAVARLETRLEAAVLLGALQAIERGHGRSRPFPNAPRTLDLDLLLFGSAQMHGAGLEVPHPRMHERAFVLRPLLELDPDSVIPGRGRADRLLAACAAQPIELLA